MANILIVYYASSFPLRATISDQLYAFRRFADQHQCFYFNSAARDVPEYIFRIHFDLVVFHTIFISVRWSPSSFKRLLEKVRPLKKLSGIKIVLPQDEFLHTDILCDFIKEFDIAHVFSVMPPDQWDYVYPNIERSRVKIHQVLTGYLDENTVSRVANLAKSTSQNRPIDIGYRAWHAAHWLGRHGQLKTMIAEKFMETAPLRNLKVDISTNGKDTLLGDKWFEFLLRCKYTIGVEGGASILDHDGTTKKCTEDYIKHHPFADFSEVERNCFPNKDGLVNLVAISPRHLEACATRTCQILIEGDYNGILKPWEHYIPLKRDFSNMNDVLDFIITDEKREYLIERAYQDIVASGLYSSRSFVNFILSSSIIGDELPVSLKDLKIFLKNQNDEKFGWLKVRIYLSTRSVFMSLLIKIFSEGTVERWKNRFFHFLSNIKIGYQG